MTTTAAPNPYETDALLAQYLVLHFGSADDVFGGVPGPREAVGFPARCVHDLIDPATRSGRALDVGCAVGASCFELARAFQEVVGIDYSRGFIEAARRLQAEGSMEVSITVEGARRAPFRAAIPSGINAGRIAFEVGDAMSLDAGLADFDVVLAANLICRLTQPMKFLSRLPGLVRPGGQLLLTTPFTWLEDYTPRENWLGGPTQSSFSALTAILEPHFTLEFQNELPFVIREHARKFQYGVAIGSRWRRNA
jgi:putative 4-mercaptohistidine N1-methyltranferase